MREAREPRVLIVDAQPVMRDAPAGTVNTGDTWITATSWTPSAKKWRKACGWAQAAGLAPGVLYIRILGIDKNVSKRDPARKVYSSTTQVDVGF